MRREIKIEDIAQLETQLLAEIDRQAEAVRGLFITNTASQPSVYLAKEAEAEAYVADPNIALGLIPNIVREAERTGDTLMNVSAVILTKAQEWRTVSAIIEDLRLGAKDAVRAAGSVVGKRTAAAVDWSAVAALASP